MYKRILTAATAAIVAVWLLFGLGPLLTMPNPVNHIVAQAE